MFGFICAIISGIAMSLQGVFNTRLGEKIGTFETNAFVQGSALVLTLILVLFWGDGDFKSIRTVNKLYLTSGILSVIIIYTVMKSIGTLGTTIGIGTILVAQLAAAAVINAFGLFGRVKITFGWHEIVGLALMTAGIVILKWKF